MSIKTDTNYVSWLVSGTVILLALMLVVLLFNERTRATAATQQASKLQRLDRVDRIQVALALAVESEKSAVLAITDSDSQQFAEQTRIAAANVERERGELAVLFATSGNPDEMNLLQQFTEAFGEFQRIDQDLLALAVSNTNLKATSLVFGPATAALSEMDTALAHLPSEDVKLQQLADTARIAAWRLLTMLPPHIAEESDAKMDTMEALMNSEDQKIHLSLDALGARKDLANNSDLGTAIACYSRFSALKTEILKLSRENTNVRSLAISLNEKRKVTLVCQAVLTALQQAIEAEPIVTYGHIHAR